MRSAAIIMFCVFFWSSGVSALAEEKTSEKEKRWKDEAEVSFVSTSGNSETSTLAGKNLFTYKFSEKIEGAWDVAALRSEDGGVTTAERYSTNLKGNYLFNDEMYAGLGAGWLRDEFSGFENRYYVGPYAGYKFLTGPKHFLKSELGLNYAREDYIDNTDSGFLEGRAFGLYEYAFTTAAKFSQTLEYLHDFDDDHNYKGLSISALTVAISDLFSIKTSYEVRYVNRPVPDTLEKTDRILTLALVANF